MSDLDNWTIAAFQLVENYTIALTFQDGKQRTINFKPVIGKGWMAELLDLEYFNKVILNDGGNLEWPNGQDFNPEALYDWDKFEQAYIDDMNNMG